MDQATTVTAKVAEFLKKWWKLILGFFAAILGLVYLRGREGDHKKFHQNSKKNLEAEIEAEKTASKKLKEDRVKIESEFVEEKREVLARVEKEKTDLEIEKILEADQLSGSIGSEIAKHLGADYVEK